MSPEDLLKMLDLGGSESTPPAESVVRSGSVAAPVSAHTTAI